MRSCCCTVAAAAAAAVREYMETVLQPSAARLEGLHTYGNLGLQSTVFRKLGLAAALLLCPAFQLYCD